MNLCMDMASVAYCKLHLTDGTELHKSENSQGMRSRRDTNFIKISAVLSPEMLRPLPHAPPTPILETATSTA